MAKKKAAPRGQLGDWLDKVPKAVQDAADEYDRSHKAKAKALGKLNTEKDVLIDKMRANKVKKVRVRNGDKLLVIDSTDKITYEKPQEPPKSTA
jgi:hypothetical protein